MAPGVVEVLGVGTSSLVGLLDDGNILKYPVVEGECANEFNAEAAIYEALGNHPRIIGYLGRSKYGLKLERGKMGDFDGKALERERYCLPRSDDDCTPSIQSDIFALGSTIFRIMTGSEPYQDLPDEDIEPKYRQLDFPAIDFTAGAQVLKCWQQGYCGVDEVVGELIGICPVDI
ncbi:hypothetical protein LTR74_004427 [Friedmanniomyces endolithicus]|nr:hypothetical protein LTR74_004427 [Friedmanniomyces endolithicus]